jgi:ribokinase
MIFVLGSVVLACSAKVARLPAPGESLLAEAFTIETGGKGFNLALGARRLGASVNGLLPVGNDPFSLFVEAVLAQTDLPATMLRRFPVPTGCGIGFTNAEGENCLAVYPAANTQLSATDIRSAVDVLHRADLVLAQFEIADEPILEAFAIARSKGARTLLNPSPFRRIDPRILELTSILVLNQVEALQLQSTGGAGKPTHATGHTPSPHIARELLQRGPDTVIVTLGSDGAMAYRKGEAPLYQAAFKVDPVDTLGAGDAFTAGFAVGTLEHRPMAECLRRAAGCGAIAVRKLGVMNALPTRDELEAFLSGCSP